MRVVDDANRFNGVPAGVVLELAPQDARGVEPVPREDGGGCGRVSGTLGSFWRLFPGPIGATLALPAGALGDGDLQDDVVGEGVVGCERPRCRVVIAQIERD
jgi:hypothetical protein